MAHQNDAIHWDQDNLLDNSTVAKYEALIKEGAVQISILACNIPISCLGVANNTKAMDKDHPSVPKVTTVWSPAIC